MTDTEPTLTRRRLLAATGSSAVGTTAAVGSAAATQTRDFGGWFDNVSNYDGVHDVTGEDEVTVDVGATGNNGNFAFAPAAIRVTPGTTVVWKWTGKGGGHDVVHTDGDFTSKLTAKSGFTFEHTFQQPGVYKYYCTPHKALGMKGAVVVENSGGGTGGGGESAGAQSGANPQPAEPRLFGVPLKSVLLGTGIGAVGLVAGALGYEVLTERRRSSPAARTGALGRDDGVRRIGPEPERAPTTTVRDSRRVSGLARLSSSETSRVRSVFLGWSAFVGVLLCLSAVLAGAWFLTGGGDLFLLLLAVLGLGVFFYVATDSRSTGAAVQWFFTDTRGRALALVLVLVMLLVGIYLTAF